MSPLWRRRVLIGLAPERLTALALGGVLRWRLLDRHAVTLHDQPSAATNWDRGLAELEALLSESPWRGREITVVLSSHYVRHAIVPPGRGLRDAEQQALVRLVFQNIFGELARDWELCISPAAPGRATLACGVPRALLTALRTVCDGAGRLRSIQPGLMPVFNQVRRKIGKSVACIALVESGRVTLATVGDGQWKYVDSRAGNGNTLPQLLLEEGELHQRQPGGILWLCDMTGVTRLPSESFWSYKRIAWPHLADFDEIPSLAIWGAP